MNGFTYNEYMLSQNPALELLQKLGYEYLTPEECLRQRGSLQEVL